ncbi:Bis(5'-nucleosyl)-tetraphosphatase [asymmetrical] [Holothuria leucospilota]|uniref:Bis(5'-nucleosyl)-tetraphosphatase [asymmetrical] n=1 Tax=Holothuria leucospilota TaxID=206669 RepID=A0A9Q1H1G5_HOLLE|nr:Bis(5'-nucleosyl)-tetraphosphatase [asymmetrical] [Holothuria leucospilota]
MESTIGHLPKGHVDPGEDFKAAALRETEEEAGLDETKFNIHNFEFRLEYSVKGRPKEVVYWLAELKDPDTPIRLSEEHQDYKWLPLSEACTYAKYEDLQKALKDAAEYIENSK